ncbi:angiopoietin-related protein 7-like [Amphibalanus amphitrite]|uniref:angiopoietin-related protein 7-like n=1 Tax=Amphibalanus amphitrite TaxID=1232801 RepID=UPI001C9268F9|nr:angiopoietin-related protein 7-like [Amphibalanus amphitrite]
MSPLLPAVVAALLTAAALPAQCSVQQQQQQQQQVAAGLYITPDELWQLVDRAVTAAIQPLTIKLDSRIDTLDSRLDVLDARLDRVFEQERKQDSEIATVRLQLGDVEKRLSDHNLQLQGQQTKVDNHELLLNVTPSQLGIAESRLDEQVLRLQKQDSLIGRLRSRIDSHDSRLDSQASQVSLYESSIGKHASRIAELNSSLETLQSRTGGQRARIDGITLRLDAAQNASTDGDSVARDCSDLPVGSQSGIYLLRPGLGAAGEVPAYCDLETDGGRWTVIQRRADIEPREDFYRNWTAYREGFGELDSEFWWGLDNMWTMTSPRDRRYELRIDFGDFQGGRRHALYQNFRISSETDGYRLHVFNYSGNAGDSLTYHSGQRFTTKDRDNDGSSKSNCAKFYEAPWWHKKCHFSSLNGKYLSGEHKQKGHGVVWDGWRGSDYSLKTVTMKIRPTRIALNDG